MQIFFASDTHFGHKKIIQLGEGLRPGSDCDEHDEILVQRWNKQVGPKRTMVVLLGDVRMSEAGFRHLGRLNGQIRIILGSHDDRWASRFRDLP